MNEIRDLLIGIDIGKEYTQICYYDRKAEEARSLSMKVGTSQYEAPGCICYRTEQNDYCVGLEAQYFSREKGGIMLGNIYDICQKEESIQVAGEDKEPAELLAHFLKGMLKFLGIQDIVKNTKCMCITSPELDAIQVRNYQKACGIAGFLLPMLYTGGLGFDVTYALALSFLAFLVSGIIGSFNYYKAGNLDVKMSLKLGIGSLIGAIAGVFLQSMIEKSTAKTILYLVVLFSGASILVRMWNEKRKAASAASNESPDSSEPVRSKSIADHMGFLIFLGITTGAICSLSGAGGPVLVMPLLVACGVSARIAVGVALFDSVFIAIPACIGYLSRITWTEVLGLLVLIVLTHGIGVWLGSRFAGKVPVQGLKIFVAVFSVCIAIYMLM